MASRGVGPIAELFDAGTLAGLDDAGLLGRFLADRDGAAGGRAFAALVERHGPMVRAVCRGVLRDDHDAEDAAQATFLILARRAGSIRRSDSAASWLFGVARRVALRARSDAARRRAREARAAVPEPVDPTSGRDPDDLTALVEEIDRLPAHARAAVVLCDLEGLTYEAAARHLGWPPGTLATRLRRARERLRSRLARRGVAVADPSLVSLLGGSPSIRVFSSPPFGRATAGGAVPRSVAVLAGRTMTMMRLKALGWGLAGLALGSAGLGVAALAAVQAPASAPTAPADPARSPRHAPPPAEPRTWIHVLPNGATVELIGVAGGASDRAAWLTPGGDPLAVPPLTVGDSAMEPEEGGRACGLAIRIGGVAPEQASSKASLHPGAGKLSHTWRKDGVQGVFGNFLPRDQRTIVLQFGIASGPWETIATAPGITGGLSIQNQQFGVAFGEAHPDAGGTSLSVAHDIHDLDVRVVAVDRDDAEHSSTRGNSGGAKNFLMINAAFDLAPDAIKEFRLQARNYEWATFEEIPLPPVDSGPAAK